MLSIDVTIYKNIDEPWSKKHVSNIKIDTTKAEFVNDIKRAFPNDTIDDSHYNTINILKVIMQNGLVIVINITKISNVGYDRLFEIMEEARNGYTNDNQNRGNN